MRSMIGLATILLLLCCAVTGSASSDLPPTLSSLVPGDRRAEVESILEDPTFVRQLDFQVCADVRVYTFLLDHPDLNADLARALGVAPYEMVKVAPGKYFGNDGAGNVGTVEVFGGMEPVRVFLEKGVSPGWSFGDIAGRVVALLTFSPEEQRVRGTVTVWARIDQGAVDVLLRVFRPMLGGFLDRKLREQFNVAAAVAESAAQHPDRVCPVLESGAGTSVDDRDALARLAGCQF